MFILRIPHSRRYKIWNKICKTLFFEPVLAFAVTGSLADGFGSSHGHRNGRRGGRQQRFRQGRQDAAPAPAGYGAGDAGAQPAYVGGDGGGALDDALGGAGDDNLAMLEKSVPGVPGEDYPIYAEVPETAFACDGQVDGGMYTITKFKFIRLKKTYLKYCKFIPRYDM